MISKVSKIIALLCLCVCVREGWRMGKLGRFCRGFSDCITMGEENRNSWVKFLGQVDPMLDKEIAKKKDNRGR